MDLKSSVRVLVTGFLMGMAEVVPGVSGGTIAFISGYYERLLTGLSGLRPSLLLILWRAGFRSAWQKADGTFLALLFGAMAFSILIFATMIKAALVSYPIAMWSFFFGLVLASSVLMYRQVRNRTIEHFIVLGIGLAVGLLLQRLLPVTLEATPGTMFMGGAIAICAWILPGVSGSFLLLLLGLYSGVLAAVASFAWVQLIPFALGAGLGLIAFANVLKRLFQHVRDWILMFLIGLMLGTLVRLWPWQQVTSYQLQAEGTEKLPLVQNPVLPGVYESLTGESSHLGTAIVVAGIAVVLVYGFERFSQQANTDV
ncbi:MAG: DUF368 domain-containing protein [Pseudomonadales bacterium]